MALKARICRTLNWQDYRYTKEYCSFGTHDLVVLLHLSGVEGRITAGLRAEWSIVVGWDPSARYEPLGKISRKDAEDMIAAARKLLQELL